MAWHKGDLGQESEWDGGLGTDPPYGFEQTPQKRHGGTELCSSLPSSEEPQKALSITAENEHLSPGKIPWVRHPPRGSFLRVTALHPAVGTEGIPEVKEVLMGRRIDCRNELHELRSCTSATCKTMLSTLNTQPCQ